MAKYTVRVTNDDDGIIAWVDMDGLKCIRQPHLPGETENWKTEAEAKAWADQHAAELEAIHLANVEAQAKEKELKEAQLAAFKAQVDSAAALAAILEKLANPSA